MVQTIRCPKCGNEFPLTEAVEHNLRAGLRAELEQERKRIEESARAKALEEAKLQAADLQNQIAELKESLAETQAKELNLRKRQRQLEAEKANLELEVQRRLDEERQKIRDEAEKRFQEQHRLKDAEKDKIIADLKNQMAEWQRRAEQGSQQLQGEVLEQDIEAVLKRAFPTDAVKPVPKGIRGADVIQEVLDRTGRSCGTILWEVKNTKSWSEKWVQKLKDDQRAAKADIAIIATTALPKGIEIFGPYSGILVSSCSCTLALATLLREQLISLANARAAAAGKQTTAEELYDYITSTQFRQRLGSIVEVFAAMRNQLGQERRSMEKLWAERERQIERVLTNTARMYGELQAISGTALPGIEYLELKPIAGKLPR